MLFLDLLLLIMTIVCVSYCWILNRRISDLQNSRVEFARMIKELDVSIIKAEKNIKAMNEISKIVSLEMQDKLNKANQVIDELSDITRNANQISHKFDLQSKSGVNEKDIALERSTQDILATNRFTKDDLSKSDLPKVTSSDNIKNFAKILKEKSETLSQTDYYNSLKKFNAKR